MFTDARNIIKTVSEIQKTFLFGGVLFGFFEEGFALLFFKTEENCL